MLTLTDVTVGQFLQANGTVNLTRGPVSDDLEITVTSSDPSRMVLSTSPDDVGKASIKVKLPRGTFESGFFIQGLANSGVVEFTANAQGVKGATGKVTLAPSGLVLEGPYGTGKAGFVTTANVPRRLTVVSALLDSSKAFVQPQAIAGGRSVTVRFNSSNATVGKPAAATLKISSGYNRATTDFQPSKPGETVVTLNAPSGLELAAERFTSINAKVMAPALNLAGPVVGQYLVTNSVVALGETAPRGGVNVTITSSNPEKMLLSKTEEEKGSRSVTLHIGEGGTNASFCIQGGSSTGDVEYTATAPGYGSRTASVLVAPTGVIVTGPASITRSGLALGFAKSLKDPDNRVPITVYVSFLDPATMRASDLAVQHLRHDVSVTVELSTADPEIGTVGSSVTIAPNTDNAGTFFTPKKVGKTSVLVAVPKAPKGFAKPTNATSIQALVTL